MDVREKLVELLSQVQSYGVKQGSHITHQEGKTNREIASHLIAHGVTVQEWISASEPPTRKDADKYGRVLAMEMGMMALVNYKGPINYPDRFPYWMPLPQPPKGE